ncbi:AAA family ATPase [uncultured Fluviicola sp.]|uniref:AAA family ATPase n=1 Tax=uncultured Fluviicola sp. TaxID=463303 RepID=UPI0025EE2DF1|nr:AAA family ATPase [uncultured Fluviicola sp.]
MKISRITINNYRAFYNEKEEAHSKYFINLKGGKNLLIYGENGSGKSSFYKALNDLFRASVESDYHFTKNVFSQELELDEEPFIQADFKKENEEKTFSFSSDIHRTRVNDELLRSVARGRSFMTYRELLRVHFVQDPQVNLFDFLFAMDGLLADLPTPVYSRPETNLKMNALLEVVRTSPDEINLKDFTQSANQILADLNETLNHLLHYFDHSMEVSFSQLTEESLKKSRPEIKVNVSYFGIDLNQQREQYHHFLNEARLSALAVCIFLAAHLSVPSPDYKILFLDDIFTGLDNSNRIPLLDILTNPIIQGTVSKTFIDHQIFLTTYDRQWYELAKNHLGNNRWHFQEMYIDRHSKGFDLPAWLPGEDDIEKSKYYFRMKQYAACANYQRKICEGLIKRFLPDYKKYDALSSGDIVAVSKLDTLISRLESYLNENGFTFDPFEKLKSCLRVVMNPLSHDDLDSPVYRRELELVFEIIDELKKLNNTILLEAGRKIYWKKKHAKTGVEREYISELTSPIRCIEYDGEKKILKFNILPLTEKDTNKTKTKISYGGSFEEVHQTFCHSLSIDSSSIDPFKEFHWKNGNSYESLERLINTKTE